jgi:hypothetical protein
MFKATKLPGQNVMHFVIAHRFGKSMKARMLYGVWTMLACGMALDYGLTDRLCFGHRTQHVSEDLRNFVEMEGFATKVR